MYLQSKRHYLYIQLLQGSQRGERIWPREKLKRHSMIWIWGGFQKKHAGGRDIYRNSRNAIKSVQKKVETPRTLSHDVFSSADRVHQYNKMGIFKTNIKKGRKLQVRPTKRTRNLSYLA
ncbi:hypothetical protein VTN00DRAFT_1053 [Thermoascus crustaceus]|uniref:uncharacterized protein n=1 Tax=Thermoascus crustaceus TaxID=5088 RepID=UPI0037434999